MEQAERGHDEHGAKMSAAAQSEVAAVAVEHITKRYDGFTAVDDVSFAPRPRWPLDPTAPKAIDAGVKA